MDTLEILKLNKFTKLIPGLLACIIISYIGILLGNIFPTIGPATFSILLGIVLGNTLIKDDCFKSGSKFAESNLLSYSIVLLGGTLSLHVLSTLKIVGFSFILIQMIFTLIFSISLGKLLGFSTDFSYLMASGNAVCGSSAIASASSTLKCSSEDKSLSITVVNLTGTVLMILLPILSQGILNFDTYKTSALLGGVLQSIGQVVGGASMINHEVVDFSLLFKILRVILLVFVVISLSFLKNKSNNDTSNFSTRSILKMVPWYIFCFFGLCILYSLNLIPSNVSSLFKVISSKLEIIALAGIGMSVNLKTLISQGPKASLYGLLIGLFQTITAIILITLIF